MTRDLDAPAVGAAGDGADGAEARPGRTLLVARHGRTAWNAEGRGQGHLDVELDEVGRAQAVGLAAYLASLRPVLLWSSDLARARQTAEVVAAVTGLGPRLDARLREFDIGVRSGLTTAEFARRLPDDHAAWARGETVRGAESTGAVLARMVPAMREALEAMPPGATGVVVTHGASLKATVAELLGWPQGMAATLRGMDNCCWASLEEQAYAGRLRLTGWNESVRAGQRVGAGSDFASVEGVG